MKDQIEVLLKRGLYGRYDSISKTASEIDTFTKEYYMKFIRWIFEKEFFYGELSDKYFSPKTDELTFNSLDDLYQYYMMTTEDKEKNDDN